MTENITITSRAKLNWLLHVGPTRADGYHEILTIFQELSLGEPMSFSRLDFPVCELEGYPEDIPVEQNLVTRAWRLMQQEYPDRIQGLRVSLKKQLPQGGGLGGGSSNAAAALKAINNLYELNLSSQRLETIGARIGSDVAFFINGGTSIARGRGEILTSLAPAPTYWLVLMFPPERMSTAEGYRLLDAIPRLEPSPHKLSEFTTALYSGAPENIAKHFHNDFEMVAKEFNWFNICSGKLLTSGAIKTLLCGSGSTIAGLAKSREHAENIASKTNGIVVSTTF